MDAAIIAGVGPGLGASLARAFGREGYAVALLSRKLQSSEPVAREIQSNAGKALALSVDVTQRSRVLEAVDQIRAELGPVSALAYNASGFGRGNFLDLDPETIRESFDVGVMGAVHLGQAVIPDMLKAGHGFISLTGATASLRGRAGFAPLAIAKSSLRMLGQSLAREFHPKGIHVVHVVVDGQIDTPKVRARDPKRAAETFIPPDAIADTVIHALRQPKNAWTHEIDIRPFAETF
ncbi:MAG TPA: SDR family NAD(P)-dependent oxidoreductase [Candidatus Binatia bacterium]|jgi:NADP-dependent 3-hydroxy acid dehydrogenase YdfG|nr:SDR family NAD(P)-dependent oxidoreductase [Candidatus Binatia bacterium]